MIAATLASSWPNVVAAFAISASITAFALRYARRRGLLDHPGKRRSHAVPTPRGGGIGIVAGVLIAGLPALLWLPQSCPPFVATPLAIALLAVAAVGWRDDHRPLPVLPRLAVHTLAALLAAGALLIPAVHAHGRMLWWLVPMVVVFVASINAHNFMDGIDGLLGLQALFVLIGDALLAASIGQTALAGTCLAGVAACLGFLLFNLPPARIFMGDVGSGVLGLLIAACAGMLVQRDLALFWPCVILVSAFGVDAGLTLARRMFAGRRWYTAHREHLYQWLVRCGWSHARTDAAYMLWNVSVAAPAAWAAWRWPGQGPWWCVAVYALGVTIRETGKRRCLRHGREV